MVRAYQSMRWIITLYESYSITGDKELSWRGQRERIMERDLANNQKRKERERERNTEKYELRKSTDRMLGIIIREVNKEGKVN